MKRSFLILLAGIVGVAIILLLRPKQHSVSETVAVSQPTPTNAAAILEIKNVPAEIATQTPPPTIAASKKPFNALSQNLADWTNAIPHIKRWTYFRGFSSWVAAPMNTNDYATLFLTGINGSNIPFIASLTSIEATNNYVKRVELHAPDMNIDETREFGDSLLGMIGKDKTGFDEWCNKVGNNWVDAPLFTSGAAQIPNSNKFYGLQTLNSFNNEKPWIIYFIITDK